MSGDAKKLSASLKVLSHPLRLSILLISSMAVKWRRNRSPMRAPNFSQSQVSQYLGILKMGYVKTQREAQVIWYSINDKNVKKIVERYTAFIAVKSGKATHHVETNDPRVFFLRLNTDVKQDRTALTLMAFGFAIERFGLL